MSEIKSDKLTPVTATTTTFGDSGDKLLFTTGTNLDMNGVELILDADADTSITADTDNQIDIKIAGADDFSFKANTFEVQTGSNIDMNGTELILDANGNTSITADTDDQIDIKIAGADDFRFTANNFNILSGSTLTVDSGATITNSGTATNFGGGKIGQVLHAIKTDRSSVTSTTTDAYAAITGLTQAITPAATSSKVLVMAYLSFHLAVTSNGTLHFGIFRDSTQVGQGAADGNRNPSTAAMRGMSASSSGGGVWYSYGIISQAFQFLDSPSTTSATTYSIKVSGGATYTSTVIFNGVEVPNGAGIDYQPAAASGLTVMEVLA